MKNLDKRLPVSRHVELATLLDPATVSLLGSTDSNKEEALYSAVMASRASQPNSSSDPDRRVSLDDVEQADANCGECEASSAAT